MTTFVVKLVTEETLRTQHGAAVWGYPYWDSTFSNKRAGRLTLTGTAGDLVKEYKEPTNPLAHGNSDNQYDLCGLIADRLEEYPEEADNNELRLRLIGFMRAMFIQRPSQASGVVY